MRRAFPSPPSVATSACLDQYENGEAPALIGVVAAGTAAEDQVDSFTHTWGRRTEYTEDRQDAILAVTERHAQLRHSARGPTGQAGPRHRRPIAHEALDAGCVPGTRRATVDRERAAARGKTSRTGLEYAVPLDEDGRSIGGYSRIARHNPFVGLVVPVGVGRNCGRRRQSDRCKRNAGYRKDLHATPPVNNKRTHPPGG